MDNSLVDQTEKKLVELLVNKEYKVGDLIPKELELAGLLKVSRTVIREALSRLRTRGMIESRKKRGSIITSPDLVSVLEKSLNPDMLDNGTLKEIFEMRLALEVGMADFIFRRATYKDIEELKTIVADADDTKSNIFEIEQEIAFHGKLYEITGNETMRKFQKMLLPVFNYVHQSGIITSARAVKNFVSHKDIVEVIENGTPDRLRKAMRAHLNSHFNRLFRQ